jgi:trk system potassium uptake protein TrkA
VKVVVVGGGKVGYYLSKTLIEHGHSPRLIERDKRLCNLLANDLDIPIICGDGTTIEVLKDANIQNADALISVTGKDENNLIACQLAKKMFHIGKTVAKANNPKNVGVMKQLGIDIVINSTDNIARLLEREVDVSKIKQVFALDKGNVTINEITIPEQHYAYDGKTLMEIGLPEQYAIISIIRDDSVIIPRGNTTIRCGDRIMILSAANALHKLGDILKL